MFVHTVHVGNLSASHHDTSSIKKDDIVTFMVHINQLYVIRNMQVPVHTETFVSFNEYRQVKLMSWTA